jgi:hypothetical protein
MGSKLWQVEVAGQLVGYFSCKYPRTKTEALAEFQRTGGPPLAILEPVDPDIREVFGLAIM